MAGRPAVRIGRVYDAPRDGDGRRVLVDRLWPRGLAKEAAAIDEWLKAVAPSSELRRWYGHDPALFEEFGRRYTQELSAPPQSEALARLRYLASTGPVTLLTATRDLPHSQAAVLAGKLAPADGAAAEPGEDRPGDPACLLRRVCPACGSVADHDPPTTCPRCHATIP
jgi:uncharacterized protein YeaO (DUF488 family)